MPSPSRKRCAVTVHVHMDTVAGAVRLALAQRDYPTPDTVPVHVRDHDKSTGSSLPSAAIGPVAAPSAAVLAILTTVASRQPSRRSYFPSEAKAPRVTVSA